MTLPPPLTVAGIRIDTPTFTQAELWTEKRIAAGTGGYVCHLDAHCVVRAQKDQAFAQALAGAALALPDGMPLVWLGRWHGHAAQRVYGPDFMRAVLAASEKATAGPQCRHFLYGSTPAVLNALTAMIRTTYPQAHIAGQLSPPFADLSAQDFQAHLTMIRDSGANVVWVGLGAPRQEKWMAAANNHLPTILMFGVGAAFDFLSGNKPQAPRAIRAYGLEWAFRWLTEPRRLSRRYLLVIPTFLWLIVRDALARLRQTPSV